MNDAAVLLAGALAWPTTVLIVLTILLATQRVPMGRLIDRIKTLKYPGGEAQLGAVPEAGAEKIQNVVDTLSRDPLTERTEREEPGEPAVPEVVVKNREPLADLEPLPAEDVTNLVMLRTKAATLLAELAFPPPPGGFGPVSATIDTLVHRGVLDAAQAQALQDTLAIADQAAAGATVPQRVAVAVRNSGPAILDQLALLRTVAAARFEDHVLDTLRKNLPADWSVDIDRAIASDKPFETSLDGRSGPMPQRHARVDALVMAGQQSAVVEVRARLQPGASGQIEAVRDWVEALPYDLPILIVMLGDGLTPRELRHITADHRAPVELLQWDRDADSLIPVLRGLFATRAPKPAPTPVS